jgi:hypothetical protein
MDATSAGERQNRSYRPRGNRLLDRQDADRLRALLPAGVHQRRGMRSSLRLAVPAGRGGFELLRNPCAADRAALGRAHAAGPRDERKAFRLFTPVTGGPIAIRCCRLHGRCPDRHDRAPHSGSAARPTVDGRTCLYRSRAKACSATSGRARSARCRSRCTTVQCSSTAGA